MVSTPSAMNGLITQFIILGVYCILFFLGCLGIWAWQIKRRHEKPPVEFKLLRGPGESLRRRMAKFEEKVIFIVGWAALAPIITGIGVLQILVWISPHMLFAYWASIVAVPMLVVLFFAGRYVMAEFTRARNDMLGYLGERAVGEALMPLVTEGYHIFHDVPAETGKLKFNVDHVAVGPNGVFAIETKTRRKGRVRPGFEAHKVAYDGRQLIWPWAEDSHGLKNAEDRARWLTDWLNKMTGLGLSAQPVLALPGWYVIPEGIGPVIVVNHKQLHGFIRKAGERFLTLEQIDLIARQLDDLCRDIED